MAKFERRVMFTPSYGSEPLNPHGIGAVRIFFNLIGPAGAVTWQIGTNWYCKGAQAHLRTVPQHTSDVLENMLGGSRHQPQAWDLGYHAREPQYEGQTPRSGDCEVLGGTCYYDGSSLNAERVIDTFLEQGDEGVWKYLEDYYTELFGAIEPDKEPVPAPDVARKRKRRMVTT